jgi:hypothetical protein
MIRSWLPAVLAIVLASAAWSAELNGVRMPDRRVVDGTTLVLNGIALRTYSIFEIPIYVAGLYLETPRHDGEAIIRSDGTKLLDMRFVHDVTAAQAQQAWIEGFEQNCQSPCYLDPQDVQRFLAGVPALRVGDETLLLFKGSTLDIWVNGRLLGHINNRHFNQVVLATFIGQVPATQRLKRELLGE